MSTIKKPEIWIHPLDNTMMSVPRNLLKRIYDELPNGELTSQINNLLFEDKDELGILEKSLDKVKSELTEAEDTIVELNANIDAYVQTIKDYQNAGT